MMIKLVCSKLTELSSEGQRKAKVLQSAVSCGLNRNYATGSFLAVENDAV